MASEKVTADIQTYLDDIFDMPEEDEAEKAAAGKQTPAKDPPKQTDLPAPMQRVKVVTPGEQGEGERTKSEIVAFMAERFGIEDAVNEPEDDSLAGYFASVEEEQEGR